MAADAGIVPLTSSMGLVNLDPSSSVSPPGVSGTRTRNTTTHTSLALKLVDHQEIKIDDQTTLLTIHTPGHTSTIAVLPRKKTPPFTADCVPGQGTMVLRTQA